MHPGERRVGGRLVGVLIGEGEVRECVDKVCAQGVLTVCVDKVY